MAFKMKEKEEHYKKIAKLEKPVKEQSKYSEEEQRAYARGQVDARNEQKRLYALKNSSEEEKKVYREEQIIKRAEYLKSKEKTNKKNKK